MNDPEGQFRAVRVLTNARKGWHFSPTTAKARSFQVSTALALLVFVCAGQGQSNPLDSWTLRNPSATEISLSGIAYGDGQFVAVGNGILSSADGVTWVQRQSAITNWLQAIAYGNGTFVAVSDPVTILTSADGVNWDLHSSGISGGVGGNIVNGIAYGNGRFVIVGGLTILTSPDGAQWIEANWIHADSQAPLEAIAYGGGRFVVMDGYDALLTSTNGLDWIELPPLGPWVTSVAYGEGRFVAVGLDFPPDPSGAIFESSSDGLTWTWTELPFSRRNQSFHLAYGNGQFVALASSWIFSSRDGVTWAGRYMLTAQGVPWGDLGAHPLAIAYGNGHFVVVGDYGTILESGSIITLGLSIQPGTGVPNLTLTGPSGSSYTIQRSTDLVGWQNVTNFTSTQSSTVILDAQGATLQHAFYRALSQ
jgi:hypothetical protein